MKFIVFSVQNYLHKIKTNGMFAPVKMRDASVFRRGAGVVTEQIANLSTGNGRQGSSPCLSASSGCSVARSSRLVWDQEVAGSNPATPTFRVSECA